jgi:serine/threonine-protein kinase RsbW
MRIPATGRSEAEGAPAPGVQTQTMAPAAGVKGAVPDEVTVRIPADGAYLSVLRTATAGLAARLDFTLDEIDDLRIAVDEACAMILGQAIPGSHLECRFSLGPDVMTIAVSVHALTPRAPTGDTFAWTVLSALAGSVDAQVGPADLVTIVLRKSRDSTRSS